MIIYNIFFELMSYHAMLKNFIEASVGAAEGDDELSCEHVNSCCVLLAKVSKFRKDSNWYTWIDYEKFVAGLVYQTMLPSKGRSPQC